jgi:hypothetical protein
MKIDELYRLLNRAELHAQKNIDRLPDILDRDRLRSHCFSMTALATSLAHTAIQHGNVSAGPGLQAEVDAEIARVTKVFGPLPV